MTYRRKSDQLEAMEIVHDGWLVKSPPEKRILKAKWRQRWFVLRHSGQLPGQFVLEYYTDTTRRKLKGKIDLDQCEQVDAGLTFESRKSNFQFMFDIRTPKRIYYLVAETESDMNKWVDCICSVCGLKIHVEEDYIPPPNNNTISSTPLCSSVQPTTNSELSRSGSNPYIPISECISGKPITNGFNCERGSCSESLPEEAPPPPPKVGNHERTASGEFYDYPKPLNSINDKSRTSPDPDEELYKVPSSVKILGSYNSRTESYMNDLPPLPPKVNWDTYPQDFLQSRNKLEPLSTTSSERNSNDDKIIEGIENQLEQISLNDSNVSIQTSLHDSIDSQSTEQSQSSTSIDTAGKPPPRPPKPRNLGRKYENINVNSVNDSSTPLYDIPPSAKGVPLSKNLPAQVFAFLKDDTDLESISPNSKVIPSVPKSKETVVPLDEIYDFPKLRSEDNINMPVPLPVNSLGSQRRRRHAYTNAPPGLFTSKETIFNYEFFKPSLLCSDVYLNMNSQKGDIYTDMSGELQLSPSLLGTYANIPSSPNMPNGRFSDIPPSVNRELKPKRKLDDDGVQNGVLTLAPPPVSRFRPYSTKRSFRKPSRSGTSSVSERSTTTPPPLPGRNHRRSEHSTSDDDLASSGGSRRNSANSEQEMKQMIPPAPITKKEEIQYLDLDLESDASVQSPRSPEKSSSASIVYKKIDFVKTKVFNEMRQNVEETYRKSQ